MGRKNIKASFKRTVRIRGCEHEFKEGMGQGVIYVDYVDIKARSKASCVDALVSEEKKLMPQIIEVKYEPVEKAKGPKGVNG